MRTSDVIEIDGSQGEGGGQVLRTALALSAVTGRPVRVDQIRARRRRPGLMRQHLAAVHAAAEVCDARVSGAELGSSRLTFEPGTPRAGRYRFSIGTAGSASLVLQAVLPPLLHAGGPSEVVVEGGTHNPLAPPADFLQAAFVPLLNRAGGHVAVQLERHGFYPAGGGRLRASVEPAGRWSALELLERGALTARRAVALVAHLPAAIGHTELRAAKERLNLTRDELELREVASEGPGNALLLRFDMATHTEIFTAFGERGRPAARVAAQALDEACTWLDADVPVGPHLADQLLLVLALGRGGRFRTLAPTPHLLTNIATIGRFLDARITCERVNERVFEVRVDR